MNRSRDWLKQALKDLEHARKSIDLRDYEWACFSSQQAAGKALKAVYLSLGMEAWGHDLTNLLRGLRELAGLKIPKRLRECAAELDKHYVISRYPNGFAEGAPWEHYTWKDAMKCVKSGERIVEWAESVIEGRQGGSD